MVYYTGDPHGDVRGIAAFCQRAGLCAADTLVILGDVGANYFLDVRDRLVKEPLNACGATVLCVHGNHECRPGGLPGYEALAWKGGTVWAEAAYPRLLFARDGDVYDLEGREHLVIGGAYSVDKHQRLEWGYRWWPDEQPDQATRDRVERVLDARAWRVPVVLSHTCPFKHEPREAFLPGLDQSTVDDCTERWLDAIDDRLDCDAWYCGHWHIDKRVGRMHFLFHSFEPAPAF